LYSPKSSRHGSIDGAYFGTTFPHLLFLVYPTLIPPKSGPADLGPLSTAAGASSSGAGAIAGELARSRRRQKEEAPMIAEGGGEDINTTNVALKAERYRPKIYGFQVNEIAKLQRWQEAMRDRCVPKTSLVYRWD